jgi:hypothetical protein
VSQITVIGNSGVLWTVASPSPCMSTMAELDKIKIIPFFWGGVFIIFKDYGIIKKILLQVR